MKLKYKVGALIALILAAFLFLMSDDSIGVTGQALNAQQGAAADYQPAVSDDRK